MKYSFDSIKQSPKTASQIILEKPLNPSNETDYHSYVFSYNSDGQKISGQLNLPNISTPSAGFPTILMLRGWVDPDQYQTGIGTQAAASIFAENGFATIAPDFLGYGSSDEEDADAMLARFRKPKDVLNLIESIKADSLLDANRLGMWGHSNGGQIALSVLEMTDIPIPTTLWAPVSKPFPYSVLYYTDEYTDGGKALRKVIADFEKTYDVDYFSINQYWGNITSPLQIHQGTSDDAVPVAWSQQLAKVLKETDPNDIDLYIYPGADHNLRPSWNTVVDRDLVFFQNHLKKE